MSFLSFFASTGDPEQGYWWLKLLRLEYVWDEKAYIHVNVTIEMLGKTYCETQLPRWEQRQMLPL